MQTPSNWALLDDTSLETNSKQDHLPELTDVSARNAVCHLKYISGVLLDASEVNSSGKQAEEQVRRGNTEDGLGDGISAVSAFLACHVCSELGPCW